MGLVVDEGLGTLGQEPCVVDVVARVDRRSGSMMFEESMLARARSAMSAPRSADYAAAITHELYATHAARACVPNEIDTQVSLIVRHNSATRPTNINCTFGLPVIRRSHPHVHCLPRGHTAPRARCPHITSLCCRRRNM